MSKHTPAPWIAEEQKRAIRAINHKLDTCNRPDILRPKEEDPLPPWIDYLADSIHAIPLYAAAPDLLAALEYTLDRIGDLRKMYGYTINDNSEWVGPWSHSVEDRARAAITKAERKE